jgi:hypothetical protein
MSIRGTYFWCHELGSPTESFRGAIMQHIFFTESEVYDFDVAL